MSLYTEQTEHEKKAIEILRSQLPALPNPYHDWLKLATKHATSDSHIAAATEAALSISEYRMLGNAVTVNVAEWLGNRLMKYLAI